MDIYENEKEESEESEKGECAKGAAKPSLRSRIRAAFRAKATLWLVVPLDGGAEKEVLYAASTKKAAFEAVNALLFRRLFPHYSMWLPLHGHDGDPRQYGAKSRAFAEYLSLNEEEVDAHISSLAIQKISYDMDGVAAMFRMLCGVAPLGLPEESAEEVSYWLMQAEEALAQTEAEAGKAKKEKEPLDKPARDAHNGKGKKEPKAARKPGRPRKKDGGGEKTPHAKKGDPNGN